MYSSRTDSIIYGNNIPLYNILYIKKTLKKIDKMIKKQNRKKVIFDNIIYEPVTY